MKRSEVLRILDANFNRSREGLRVCEEITRFVLESEALTGEFKKIRHAVTAAIKKFPASIFEVVAARDIRRDVGKKPSRLEKAREDALEIFAANAERVKESLRVLEETSKLIDKRTSDEFKKIRFRTYAIEKKVIKELDTLHYH